MSYAQRPASRPGRSAAFAPPDGSIRWHAIPPRPEYVARAREHAIARVRRSGAPAEHVDDVARVATELVTNAVQATIAASRPPQGTLTAVSLGVRALARCTLVEVRDAVPVEPVHREPYTDEHGELHGLGLGIVDALCATWWTAMRAHDKTVYALVPRPGVTLTPRELTALRR